MRRLMMFFAALFVLAAAMAAQTTGQASSSTSSTGTAAAGTSQGSAQAGTAAEGQQPASGDAKSDKDKKKKDKKKKKKDSSAADMPDTSMFSDRVAQDVLSQLRDGLEGRMQRTFLNAFDGDKMDGYLQFEDQIEAFFRRYDSFRVHFRIAQTAIEGTRGVVLVDVELEQAPAGGAAPPVRKRNQMRFELERGRKGWKIVDFRPRGFFS